jgi:hypothetical protein
MAKNLRRGCSVWTVIEYRCRRKSGFQMEDNLARA